MHASRGNAAAGILAMVIMAIVAVLIMAAVLGSWFIVDQGERGVVLRNGALNRVANPGLNFKWPIIESVHEIDIRDGKRIYDKLSSYSNDIQLAHLRIAVNYKVEVSRVEDIYARFQTVENALDRVLTPRVAADIKIVFGRYTATRAVGERGKMEAEMEAALRSALEGSGLVLTSMQLEEIDFSKAFEASIEARMKEEVEVAKLRQTLEKEKVQADIKRTTAAGEADARVTRAKSEAEAIRLRGDAEAAAIRARSTALAQNAALIELVKAEKWDGHLPTTMLPNAATPLLSIK